MLLVALLLRTPHFARGCLARLRPVPPGKDIMANYSAQTAHYMAHKTKVMITRRIGTDRVKEARSAASRAEEEFLAKAKRQAKQAEVVVSAEVAQAARRKRPKIAIAAPLIVAAGGQHLPLAPPLPPPAVGPAAVGGGGGGGVVDNAGEHAADGEEE